MWVIKVPATSANIGVGFDCMGVALDLYNTFYVKKANEDRLIDVEERFTSDNLFLKAYRKGCEALKVKSCIEVRFACDVPISRGLGSSATMIVGGLIAAYVLHDVPLDENILTLATDMEGHPDNVTPALYGGLQVSSLLENTMIHEALSIDSSFHFTLFIPDFELSTSLSRKALPEAYPSKDAHRQVPSAILTTLALAEGDASLLKKVCRDRFHEPYRKHLIPHFDTIQNHIENHYTGVFLISGAGSACLSITKEKIRKETVDFIHSFDQPTWNVKEVQIANGAKFHYE